MNNIIRKLKRKYPVERLSTKDRKIAEYYGEKLREESWERDKYIVRMQNFEKARLGLQAYREAIQAEKDRLALINETRLLNLEKARKAKKKR